MMGSPRSFCPTHRRSFWKMQIEFCLHFLFTFLLLTPLKTHILQVKCALNRSMHTIHTDYIHIVLVSCNKSYKY